MKYITLPNYGILKDHLYDDELFPIYEEIREIVSSFDSFTNRRFNGGLVGNIEHEYGLEACKDYIYNLLIPRIKYYEDETGYLKKMNADYYGDKDRKTKLKDCWVNFQKRHEFNPAHFHSGLLSFIFWIRIPYSIEDEKEKGIGKYSKNPMAGTVEFLYNKTDGRISSMTFEPEENVLLLFPAFMYHAAYPFSTSDEFRISVAGNIEFDL